MSKGIFLSTNSAHKWIVIFLFLYAFVRQCWLVIENASKSCSLTALVEWSQQESYITCTRMERDFFSVAPSSSLWHTALENDQKREQHKPLSLSPSFWWNCIHWWRSNGSNPTLSYIAFVHPIWLECHYTSQPFVVFGQYQFYQTVCLSIEMTDEWWWWTRAFVCCLKSDMKLCEAFAS